jgi:hypothetical protein
MRHLFGSEKRAAEVRQASKFSKNKSCVKYHLHWRRLLAKPSAILYLCHTWLGHLGQRDRDRIISSLCRADQGGQGEYIVWCCRWRYSDKLCQWKHGLRVP